MSKEANIKSSVSITDKWEIKLNKEAVINCMITWLDKAMKDMFESSRSNPLKDVIQKIMKEEDSEFKILLREVIIEIVKWPELKDKVRDFMAEKIIKDWLK